jgi:sugar phosphate isomerase/epimerase
VAAGVDYVETDVQRTADGVGAENAGIVADLFHMNIEEADLEAALELDAGVTARESIL